MPYNAYADTPSFRASTLSYRGTQRAQDTIAQPPRPSTIEIQEQVALYVDNVGYLTIADTLKLIHYILSLDENLEKFSNALGTLDGKAALLHLKDVLDNFEQNT